jgi:hypothetical protein
MAAMTSARRVLLGGTKISGIDLVSGSGAIVGLDTTLGSTHSVWANNRKDELVYFYVLWSEWYIYSECSFQ